MRALCVVGLVVTACVLAAKSSTGAEKEAKPKFTDVAFSIWLPNQTRKLEHVSTHQVRNELWVLTKVVPKEKALPVSAGEQISLKVAVPNDGRTIRKYLIVESKFAWEKKDKTINVVKSRAAFLEKLYETTRLKGPTKQ